MRRIVWLQRQPKVVSKRKIVRHRVIGTEACSRPGKGRSLRVGDLVAPASTGAPDLQKWASPVAPWERQQSTKTGQFDETVDEARHLLLVLVGLLEDVHGRPERGLSLGVGGR